MGGVIIFFRSLIGAIHKFFKIFILRDYAFMADYICQAHEVTLNQAKELLTLTKNFTAADNAASLVDSGRDYKSVALAIKNAHS